MCRMKRIPTRVEMLAALDDPNPANPLAVAIADCIASYGAQLNEQARRAGEWPNPLKLQSPRTELESFALELFTAELAKSGIRVIV